MKLVHLKAGSYLEGKECQVCKKMLKLGDRAYVFNSGDAGHQICELEKAREKLGERRRF